MIFYPFGDLHVWLFFTFSVELHKMCSVSKSCACFFCMCGFNLLTSFYISYNFLSQLNLFLLILIFQSGEIYFSLSLQHTNLVVNKVREVFFKLIHKLYPNFNLTLTQCAKCTFCRCTALFYFYFWLIFVDSVITKHILCHVGKPPK